MRINNIEIKKIIKAKGFIAQEGDKDVFYKSYAIHNNYLIKINFETEKIEYRSENIDETDGVRWGDATTSNFENSENFVVLECVDSLLSKGYPPSCLELECKIPLGKKEKGKLDILVYDKNGVPFIMIECKTWGIEYEKEKKKMISNGGQLFSYYATKRAPQYLCLYTSILENDIIKYKNEIVKVDEQWRELSDQKEIYDHWNKNFKDNGIFDDWAEAYGVEIKSLVRGRLEELSSEDSSRIYNQFAEILRHNVVSDKPNAFNKILNLFICKIIDENKRDDEEVDFQWFENDTNENLQSRLNELYKKGMKRFLDIDVTDYTEKDITDKLINVHEENVRLQIKKMFEELRLQKNPEFAFKEVYNTQSFVDNSVIVREIVELLQPYQFRYGHKQQFLGDFFELLLNTSIKQESGQFFTPVPITRFIVSSLPISEIIDKKIKDDEAQILPIAIDYATGSGHFLTEWMDQLQEVIKNFEIKGLRRAAASKLKYWKDSEFQWANETVYGIEADYRLVKTTKVSSFLNGDGEAIIIRANGLDNFEKSKQYKGKLKEVSKDYPQDNAQFDVLITNPPYSVASFKNTIEYKEQSFDLYNRLTDDSSEIECLFVERAKQLLKVGGYAGIILPSSILNNSSNIYIGTREIILKYFKIKAIVEFGSNTFMATGTNTVTLFLERRDNIDYQVIKSAIDNFFNRPKDATVNGIEESFSKYVAEVYHNINLDDYITLINKVSNYKMKEEELFIEFIKWFNELTEVKQLKDKKVFKSKTVYEQQTELDKMFYEKIFEKEKDKMLYFLLTYSQKTVIVKVGEKQAEKDFIGYEFSKRRGNEGIKMYRDENNNLTTKLFDEKNPHNENKVNSYIYKAFLNQDFVISDQLKENITVTQTTSLIDFSKLNFEKSISLNYKKKILLKSKYPLRKLGEICDVRDGTHDSPKFQQTGFPLITSKNITSGRLDFTNAKLVSEENFNKINERSFVEENDILFAMIGTVGSPVIVDTNKKFAIKNVALFKFKGNILLLNKYLKEVLNFKIVKEQINFEKKGSNRSFVSLTVLRNLLVPLPPKDIQQKIVDEIDSIEKIEQISKENISMLKNYISNQTYFSFAETNLNKISTMICRGKSVKYGNSDIQIIKSGQARGYQKFDFTTQHYVSKTFISDERNLMKDDILINSTGVGTAGRVTLFDLDGNFVADSHITIVRLDKLKALPKYVLYSLANIGFKNIEKMATGQSGQIELSLPIIKSIKIPLPSLTDQLKIVSEIEAAEIEIYELEAKINKVNIKRAKILEEYLY